MFKLKIIDKPEMFKMKCNFEFPKIPIENLQEKEIDPATKKQEVVPDKEYSALSKVTVNAVTSDIDKNILSKNIRSGVEILGVAGWLVPLNGEERTVTPTKSTQVIEPSEGKNAITKVTVKPYTPIVDTKTITSNGTYNASDDNLDGYSQVKVTVPTVDINDYFKDTVSYKGYYSSDWQNIIKKIPPIKVTTTDASYIFYNCQIDNFIQIDTSIVTRMDSMFYAAFCKNIPELDASKVNYIQGAFLNCNKLENFGGLLNLGQAYPSITVQERYALNLATSNNLTHDSLMNVLNKVYDISNKGTQIINLGNTNKSKLTAEEIAIATNKGWTVN